MSAVSLHYSPTCTQKRAALSKQRSAASTVTQRLQTSWPLTLMLNPKPPAYAAAPGGARRPCGDVRRRAQRRHRQPLLSAHALPHTQHLQCSRQCVIGACQTAANVATVQCITGLQPVVWPQTKHRWKDMVTNPLSCCQLVGKHPSLVVQYIPVLPKELYCRCSANTNYALPPVASRAAGSCRQPSAPQGLQRRRCASSRAPAALLQGWQLPPEHLQLWQCPCGCLLGYAITATTARQYSCHSIMQSSMSFNDIGTVAGIGDGISSQGNLLAADAR